MTLQLLDNYQKLAQLYQDPSDLGSCSLIKLTTHAFNERVSLSLALGRNPDKKPKNWQAVDTHLAVEIDLYVLSELTIRGVFTPWQDSLLDLTQEASNKKHITLKSQKDAHSEIQIIFAHGVIGSVYGFN